MTQFVSFSTQQYVENKFPIPKIKMDIIGNAIQSCAFMKGFPMHVNQLLSINYTGDQKNDMLCDVCFLTNFGSLIPNVIFIFLG